MTRRPTKHRHRAIVQRYRLVKVGDLNTRERAWLPCGCAIYIGAASGSGEPATRAQPCSEGHARVLELANQMLVESLAKPSRTPLVEVCAKYLTAAAQRLI